MTNELELFDHVFINNQVGKTCFLLHGTGGTKEDFLFLNDELADEYNFVGLRGNIDEQGYRRFFKRLSPGVFDQNSLKQEAEKLYTFIRAWTKAYPSTTDNYVYLGYSNGANMLLTLLFQYPEIMRKVVLLHPMVPLKFPPENLNLSQVSVLVTSGDQDQMVPKYERQRVIHTLELAEADLTVKKYSGGHEIDSGEINDVVDFMR